MEIKTKDDESVSIEFSKKEFECLAEFFEYRYKVPIAHPGKEFHNELKNNILMSYERIKFEDIRKQ